ncbi:hypothetical protein F1880_006601 [Penicillium rolfsii]|nr:hypothetical protein F1880_006601 [Penicillium rolfsii]
MYEEFSYPMVNLPLPLDQDPDVRLTKDPPTWPGDSQGTVRRSVTLSSYGVGEMMDEERQRYQRSASLSLIESNKSRTHQLSPNEPFIPPEVPPFRLLSERQIDQKHHIEGANLDSRKRKRSLSISPEKPVLTAPSSNALVLSASQRTEPERPCNFRGVIVHRRAEEALGFAWKMETCTIKTDQAHRHIFWTDASIVFGACAAGAVVWKQPPLWAWKAQGFPYPHLTTSTEVVEMFAIAQALKRAVDDVKQSQGDAVKDLDVQITHEVFVFTDSINALTRVENDAQGNHARKTSQQALSIIEYSIIPHDLGAKVELHLVPGHNGVPGNTRAHGAAYAAAKCAAAEAGITSIEQGFALHKYQESLAMDAPAVALSVSAGKPTKAQKSSSLLSQPLLWNKLREKTPPKLVSLPDQTDGNEAELVNMNGEQPMSVPGPHSFRPDRTPELASAPGPSFTSINAGSLSVTESIPINVSPVSLVRSSAKVSFSRIK